MLYPPSPLQHDVVSNCQWKGKDQGHSHKFLLLVIVWLLVVLGLLKDKPGDRLEVAPNNMHVIIASHRLGDFPDPCSVPRTQS